MDDLILRAAAIDAIVFNSENKFAVDVLNDVPAVDAAPVVRARWIHCKGKSHIWYCSNCGEKVNYNNAHKVYTKDMKPIGEVNRFCRNCGAKMEGEAHEH